MGSRAEHQETGDQLPTVLVHKRNSPLHDDDLDMKSDAREIPDPLQPAASYLGKERLTLKDVVNAKSNQSRWVAVGSFTGKARVADKISIEDVSTGLAHPMAMVIVETESRLLGILGPEDPNEPAIWWAWPLNALAIRTEGVQGTFRKRPRQISIHAFDSQIDLFEVSYLRNDRSSLTTGREAAFLKALGVPMKSV